MLAEMTRDTLDAPHQIDHQRDLRRRDVHSAALKQRGDIVMVIAKFVGLIEPRQFVDLLRGKAEHLGDLAHRASAAIGDHIRRHRAAAFPVAAINVLDDFLALFAAGQIEIYIGPFAAFLGEKALEQKFHLDRVDSGDSERVADRAVGRRAAALRHDSILAAKLHDIPHDQKITGEFQLLDHHELMFELGARAIVECCRPIARGLPHRLARANSCQGFRRAEAGSRESDSRDR